jgi:GT2 family glycosyltransferase
MTITLPRSDDPRVSIIIPSSVRTDLLRSCLQSLVRHAPAHIPFEAIVVLNETGAGVAEELRATVRGAEFAHSPVNLGVAGAGNLGRALARGEYLIFLHDDAQVLPGWMEALVETADAHPEAGAIGSKVLDPDGSLQNVGAILWRDATTSRRWSGEPPAFEAPEAADYCGTSSLLVRRSAFDAIGGLDEQIYPAYYVDVDLGIALWQADAAVLCQPKSRVHHQKGASTHSRYRDFLSLRNRAHVRTKWAAALAGQEPFDDNSPASIARAASRAQTAWERCRAAPRRPQGARPALDPARQQAEHEVKALALQKAYVAYLEHALETAEADCVGLRQRVAELAREREDVGRAYEALLRGQ